MRLCVQALGLTGEFNPNLAQPRTSGAINSELDLAGFPGPLSQLPDNTSHVFDDYHRSNIWIKDRWQPNNNWTLEVGARWDEADLDLPSNAPAQNMFFFTQGNCNVNNGPTTSCQYFDQPGVAIASDVTRPSFVSPRLALSYQLNPRDVLRASYGRFMEFTPIRTSRIRTTSSFVSRMHDCKRMLHAVAWFRSNVCQRHHYGLCQPWPALQRHQQPLHTDPRGSQHQQFRAIHAGQPQLATSIDFSVEHDFGYGLK